MNKVDERAQEARLDWALGEVVGEKAPPDLLAAVRARLVAPAVPEQQPRSGFWFAAACVLLGVSVIVAVWLDRRSGAAQAPVMQPDAPVLQQPETEPAWVTVGSAEEIDKLAADCTAVRLFPESAQDVEALTRLRQLSHLDLGLAATDQDHPPLDAAMLRAVGHLHTLRELRLDYRKEIQPSWLHPLEDLPLLQTLGLRFVPVDDAAAARLVRLGSLSRLELTFDNQLGDAGVAAIAGIRTLRTLSLRGCGNITPRGMAALGRCTQLEQLDLGCVNGTTTWLIRDLPELAPRASSAGIRSLEQRLLASDMSTSRSVGRGVDDDVLVALSALGRLSVLRLGGAGPVTERGLGAIAGLPLRELDLWVRDAEFAPFVAQLPPTVEKLGLGWCNTLTGADLAALAKRLPRLSELDVSGCTGLADAGLIALLQHCPLRRLNLSGCTGLTRAIVPTVVAKASLSQLVLTGLQWVDAEVLGQLHGRPDIEVIISFDARFR